MSAWKPNTGQPPYRDASEGPPINSMYVRLRNGHEPPAAWPVKTPRGDTTRWTLTGHGYDIIEWREA